MKPFTNRKLAFVFLLSWAWATASDSTAATIFESGTLGPIGLTFADFDAGGAPDGSSVTPIAFSGVRFELTEPVLTTRIGGHFVIQPNAHDSFFGAIVRLDDISDFPDSGDFSTPDFLGNAFLTFPNTSEEVFGELSLRLNPGWYALVFGSGLFGTTGNGGAVLNNPDMGSPSYLAKVPGSEWIEVSSLPGPFENYRLVVEGVVVPEPNTLALNMLGITFFIGLRKVLMKLRK